MCKTTKKILFFLLLYARLRIYINQISSQFISLSQKFLFSSLHAFYCKINKVELVLSLKRYHTSCNSITQNEIVHNVICRDKAFLLDMAMNNIYHLWMKEQEEKRTILRFSFCNKYENQ